MKRISVLLLVLSSASYAQNISFNGVYKLPELKDMKQRLKPWDTIRDAFTFIPDSFKYSYAVMRPNGRVAVSVDYDEYGLWHVIKDTMLSEPDKITAKSFSFRRVYVTLDDGRITGYFEPRYAADSVWQITAPSDSLVFVRNNRVFYYSGRAAIPLQKQ